MVSYAKHCLNNTYCSRKWEKEAAKICKSGYSRDPSVMNSNWSGCCHLILTNYKHFCFRKKKKKKEENLRPFIMPLTEECGSSIQRAIFTWMKGTEWSMLQPPHWGPTLCCCLAWLSSGPGGWGAHRGSRIRLWHPFQKPVIPCSGRSQRGLGQVTLRLRASVSPSVKREVWTGTVVPSPSRTLWSLVMVLWLN